MDYRLRQRFSPDEGPPRDIPSTGLGSGGRRLPHRGFDLEIRLNADLWLSVRSPLMPRLTTSAPLTFEWMIEAYVIEISGSTVADGSAEGMASVGVMAKDLNTSDELFTSDKNPSPMLYGDLFGLQGQRTMPAGRRVKRGDKWILTWRNDHPTRDFTASLGFAVRRIGECEE